MTTDVWTDRGMYNPKTMELLKQAGHDPGLVLVRMSWSSFGRFIAAVEGASRRERRRPAGPQTGR
jgi:hypothetical protein